jgi:hypothetical protein
MKTWARMLAAAIGVMAGAVIVGTALIVIAFSEDEGSSRGSGWMLALGIAIVVVASAAVVWSWAVAGLAVLLGVVFGVAYSGEAPDGDGIYMVAAGGPLVAIGVLALFRDGRGRREGPPASPEGLVRPSPSGAPSTPAAEPEPRSPPS